jgi:glutathione S-transferase
VSDETKKETERDLEKGMKAVSRLFVCDPYAAGKEMTLADFYTFYTFGLANGVSQKLFGKDLLAEHPNIQSLMELLSSQPSIARVEQEKAS